LREDRTHVSSLLFGKIDNRCVSLRRTHDFLGRQFLTSIAQGARR
jgi:hypothetical protein